MFSKELKKFRLKKNPTIEDLESALLEIETLLSLSNADMFITDAILQSLKMLEGVSRATRYNITGLSDILKSNPQFTSLSRQLYIKYGSFVNIPCEYQLVMLVMTSTYIAINTNRNLPQMNSFLNEPHTRR
jgi:hypothetical protein